MNFLNNWARPIEIDADSLSATLDIPDGRYRLTATDSETSPTRWEIIDAVVIAGVATLDRGREGTLAQAWPGGSVIYNDVTAGALNDFEVRLRALESGGGSGVWVDIEANEGWSWSAHSKGQARLIGDVVELRGELYFEDTTENSVAFNLPPEMLPVWPEGTGGYLYMPVVCASNSDQIVSIARIGGLQGAVRFSLSDAINYREVVIDGIRFTTTRE